MRPGTSLVVTFDEAVQRTSGGVLLSAPNGTFLYNFPVTVQGTQVTANLPITVAYDSEYTFQFNADSFEDVAGNAFAGATWHFHTIVAGKQVFGTSGNETLVGGAGDDTIHGGAGRDTFTIASSHAAAGIHRSGAVVTVDGPDGIDTLHSVERLAFNDAKVALDIGFALTDISANFIESPEFTATYGSLNNVQFVTRLYLNVLGRAPDQGGLDFHVANLVAGLPRKYLLAQFSESPDNQANVIGAIENGMVYVL